MVISALEILKTAAFLFCKLHPSLLWAFWTDEALETYEKDLVFLQETEAAGQFIAMGM